MSIWKVEFTCVFAKNLKQLDPQIQRFFLLKILPKIQAKPEMGIILQGKVYKNKLKYKFRANKTDYRVLYTLERKRLVVLMLLIGSRENFY